MHSEMGKAEKIANLGAVVFPFAATVAAAVLFWNRLVSPADLLIAATMYLLTAIGITVGYHRLLTHRSFQTAKPVEYLFAALGSMAVQGPVISWVADHRKHHAHTDKDGDPHSPHVGRQDGVGGVLAGLWHAHTGWLMSTQGQADWKRYAPDLYEDPGMRTISRRFVPLLLAGLALPALAGYLVSGTVAGAATGLLWGGLVRIFSSITSPGASIRCAISSAAGVLTPMTAPPTSSGWHCRLSVSHGTTITTPSRVQQYTD